MARVLVTALLIGMVSVFVGCAPVDTGTSRWLPRGNGDTPPGNININKASEADIVEQMAASRDAYRQGLEVLVQYYAKAGYNMKLKWARKELSALGAMPRYSYIIEAGVAGPDLRASDSIGAANNLFADGDRLERQGGMFGLLKNNNTLRLSLVKFKSLISRYPTSDKIDDAAYQAGYITEYFRDYQIALVYYQRAYQWDARTPYPARFREAHILDVQLHRRAEALDAYQRALSSVSQGEHRDWVSYAKKRVAALTKTVKPEQ